MTDTNPAPTVAKAGITPGFAKLRVVDAKTGETIGNVLEADADAGTLTRAVVKDGNLVRIRDSFEVVTEDRALRIEWIEPETLDLKPDAIVTPPSPSLG